MQTSPQSPYTDKPDAWSSHSIITGWLRALPQGSRVLDVGTATGTLGRMCKSFGLVMNGVEPFAEWAELSKPYYDEIHIGYIEQTPDEFLHGYDAVLCADILEHTINPDRVLDRLASLQPERCLYLVSVPNFANIYVRLHILVGKFDYEDRGLLDRTHLRAFTRKTILDLVKKTGLEVLELKVTPIPLDLVFPKFRKKKIFQAIFWLLKQTTLLFPTLLGYQFVIKAQKHG